MNWIETSIHVDHWSISIPSQQNFCMFHREENASRAKVVKDQVRDSKSFSVKSCPAVNSSVLNRALSGCKPDCARGYFCPSMTLSGGSWKLSRDLADRKNMKEPNSLAVSILLYIFWAFPTEQNRMMQIQFQFPDAETVQRIRLIQPQSQSGFRLPSLNSKSFFFSCFVPGSISRCCATCLYKPFFAMAVRCALPCQASFQHLSKVASVHCRHQSFKARYLSL